MSIAVTARIAVFRLMRGEMRAMEKISSVAKMK